MRAKLFTTVVLVIFVSVGLSFSCHNENDKIDPGIFPILVEEEAARNVALNFLNIRSNLPQGGMPEWRGAMLSTPIIYYSSTGNPAAYCFSVIKDGEDLGYILISADKTRFPIQEFSRSPAPHKRAWEPATRIAQANLREGQRLGEPTIVYPSLGIYFTVFPILEGEEKVGKMVVCSRGLFLLPQEILKLKADLPTKEMAKEAKREWNWLKKKNLKLPQLQGYVFKYIENVPVYPYLISCAPVITAAFLDYWGIREEGESKKELIAEVARHIKEVRGGMTIYNIPGKIEEIARIRGYSLKTTIRCRTSANPQELITFKGYKKEIDKGYPPILLFPFGPGAGKDLFTALTQMVQFPSIGVGYSSDPSGDYIIVRESLFANEKEEDVVQGESPWAKTGATFYNWRGASGNLIVISIPRPERERE
jgi:hypothetical protein